MSTSSAMKNSKPLICFFAYWINRSRAPSLFFAGRAPQTKTRRDSTSSMVSVVARDPRNAVRRRVGIAGAAERTVVSTAYSLVGATEIYCGSEGNPWRVRIARKGFSKPEALNPSTASGNTRTPRRTNNSRPSSRRQSRLLGKYTQDGAPFQICGNAAARNVKQRSEERRVGREG